MWYVVDKYTRLLKKNKEETKGDVTTKSKKNKVKFSKNSEGEQLLSTPEKKTGDKGITNGEAETGRRRSSRVAQAEVSRDLNKSLNRDYDSPKSKKKIKLEKPDEKIQIKQENSETKNVEAGENGCHSDSEVTEDAQEKPWVPVYLTKDEVNGLRCLMERLRTWQYAQKCIPSTISDSEALLTDLEVRLLYEYYTFFVKFRVSKQNTFPFR
jgi:hypothetical protein